MKIDDVTFQNNQTRPNVPQIHHRLPPFDETVEIRDFPELDP
jgi:hypothetical protein